MATSISIFSKLQMMTSPTMFSGMVERMIEFVVMAKAVIVMINVQNLMRCMKRRMYKRNGHVAPCAITGFMKNASMIKDSIISIDLS